MEIEFKEEFYDRMSKFREKALENAAGDQRTYYKYMLKWRKVCGDPSAEEMTEVLKKAQKARDYGLMQRCFYTYWKSELSCFLSSGYDHSYMIYRVIPFLSGGEYSEIFRAYPEDLPMAGNGHSMLVNGTGVLQCILYKGRYDEAKAVAKAEKYVASKQPKWDRAFVACLLAVYKSDAKMLSENLQLLCELNSRNDIPGFLKEQCQTAYGMVVFAAHNMEPEVFNKVQMPEYKNFDPEYMEFALKGEFSRDPLFRYDEPYAEFNHLFEFPLPLTVADKKNLDSDNSYLTRAEKNAYYMNVDAMNDEIIERLMECKSL